jgi:hypothetical protein
MNIVLRETDIAIEDNCRLVAELWVGNDRCIDLYHNTAIENDLGKRTLLFGVPHENVTFENADWSEIIVCFAKERGYQKVIGPINGNTWNTYRFCTDNYGKLFFTDISSDPGYIGHLEARGFVPTWQYVSGRLDTAQIKLPIITNRSFFERELVVTEIAPNELPEYLPKMYPVVSSIFSENVLFSSISEISFIEKYMHLQPVLQKGDLFVVSHDENIVGFGLTLDDRTYSEKKGMVTKTIGRVKDRAYVGVGAWISELIYKKYLLGNYDYMVHAFMYVGNNSLKISRIYGGEIIKKYAVYVKNI